MFDVELTKLGIMTRSHVSTVSDAISINDNIEHNVKFVIFQHIPSETCFLQMNSSQFCLIYRFALSKVFLILSRISKT